MGWIQNLITKLNPAQPDISMREGHELDSTEIVSNYYSSYEQLECVRRGVDLVVNAAACFNYDIGKSIPGIPGIPGLRLTRLEALLNNRPNPYQTANKFRRNIFTDFILEGNIFLYWDGAYLYHLPSTDVTIVTDPKTFVRSYTYGSDKEFTPDEVIHIADNNPRSIYRGSSRLRSADNSVKALNYMQQFQSNFFKNGAIPGLVITSPNPLGDKIKDRLLASWSTKYSPTAGGRRPLILDGGLEVKNLMDRSFQELDFQASITTKEETVLLAIGVPYILLRGGNNANITPNIRLMYMETVLPIVNALASALECFFGYDIKPDGSSIPALQPELKDVAQYYTTLVNGGVLYPNEAREGLRFPKDADPESDKLRIPANIAGSASDPSQGGRPTNAQGSNT